MSGLDRSVRSRAQSIGSRVAAVSSGKGNAAPTSFVDVAVIRSVSNDGREVAVEYKSGIIGPLRVTSSCTGVRVGRSCLIAANGTRVWVIGVLV